MKNFKILNFLKRKYQDALSSIKYKWDYLFILNSPFRGLKILWYWGKIEMGTPYFLPRKWVKMSREDCEESLQKDLENAKKYKWTYVNGRDWTYYKNHLKPVPIKFFGFNFTTLGWKTKWDDYRFEWNPIYSFVIFGKQLCLTIVPNVDKEVFPDVYWEAWLNYRFKTDRTKSKRERLEELKKIYSCTWTSHKGENERVEVDYYPMILKPKYS